MRKIIIAILSLALIASLAACEGNPSAVEQPSGNPQQNTYPPSVNVVNHGIEKIVFPAYELQNTDNNSILDIDTVNHTPVFTLSFPLQENWEIKREKGDETLPTGVFYTPVYLYENDKLIGYIAFAPFEFEVEIPEDVPKDDVYPYIFPSLRLSSQFQWEPYTSVKGIENGGVGVVDIYYMDPNDIVNHPGAMPDVDQFATIGIVAYDIELRVSAAIAFMPDTISKNQAIEIAKNVEIISGRDY